jgi:SAM-dependent methyltransferase
VATRAERARSFGAVAASYDRLRPSPAPDALDWLVPDGCRVAVDLAAGTGLFTRPLAQRVERVIAVEPDPQMREVLAAQTPGVEVREGTGESIPLGDGSVDAVFVSSAWHWFDHDRAIEEIARIVRPGGRLGVLWSSRDRDVDWVRELDRLPGRPLNAEGEDEHRRRREPQLRDRSLFTDAVQATFTFTRRMAVDDVVELTATYSAVITAPEEVRQEVLARARGALDQRFPEALEIDFPMRSRCWRATRVISGTG